MVAIQLLAALSCAFVAGQFSVLKNLGLTLLFTGMAILNGVVLVGRIISS